MNYPIDQKLIALFLQKAEDSPEVADYMEKYTQKITALSEAALYNYLKEKKNMSEEQVKQELTRIRENFDKPEIMNSAVFDDEALVALGTIRADLNRKIFEYYQMHLPVEGRLKVNEYLDELELRLRTDVEIERRIANGVLDGILAEYNATGKIRSYEEVEAEREDELKMISLEEQIQEELDRLGQ